MKNKDLTSPPFLGKIILYALPMMATSVLQLVYNAADTVVVGRFAGAVSLAAVSSTSVCVNLIVNLFIGISMGGGVVVARHIGEEDGKAIHRSVHSTMLMGFLFGLLTLGIGCGLSGKLLAAMGTPAEVLPLSTLYLRIFFLGAPGAMTYNFGAAVLRANGDTKRPLLFLSTSGLVNVGLNLLLVIKFKMDVAGVAIATITSQYLSCIMIIISLCRMQGPCCLQISKLRLYGKEVWDIVRIGFPAGLQSVLFSLSNVLIQSTVNSFGSLAMAGNGAAVSADSFIYACVNAVSQTGMIFTSQNFGAKKYNNISKIFHRCLSFSIVMGIGLGIIGVLFPAQIISVFSEDSQVIPYGVSRLMVMMPTYFLCGLMDVVAYQLRGIGSSFEPMLITLVGSCGIRILWIYTVFPLKPELTNLYYSYPISWLITFVALYICFSVKRKHIFKKSERQLDQKAENELKMAE